MQCEDDRQEADRAITGAQEGFRLYEHTKAVRALVFSHDGSRLYTAADDFIVIEWELSTRKISTTFVGHQDEVYCVSLSPTEQYLATGSGDGTFKVWDTGMASVLFSRRSHSYTCQFCPTKSLVVSGCSDDTIKVWDLPEGNLVCTLEGHSHSIRSMCWTHDGTKIISGSYDHTIKIWDYERRVCLRQLIGHDLDLRSVTTTQDDSLVVSASEDHTVRVWNLETGDLISTLAAHENWVFCVGLSSDDEYISSGSSDNTLVVHSRFTGECLARLRCGSTVYACGFSPDNSLIAAGTSRGVTILWRTGLDQVAVACSMIKSIICIGFLEFRPCFLRQKNCLPQCQMLDLFFLDWIVFAKQRDRRRKRIRAFLMGTHATSKSCVRLLPVDILGLLAERVVR